jgi:hypothetical protein
MLDILENANVRFSDVELNYTNSEQRKMFRDRFNTSSCPRAYAITEDEFIFEMAHDSFGSFEYYAGMEYEREHLVLKIQSEGDLLVVYNRDCTRAENIIAMLDPEALDYDEDEE